MCVAHAHLNTSTHALHYRHSLHTPNQHTQPTQTLHPLHTPITPPPQVYFPYLLMNKKRYAGLLWTKTEKWDKMDSKVGLREGVDWVWLGLVAWVVSGFCRVGHVWSFAPADVGSKFFGLPTRTRTHKHTTTTRTAQGIETVRRDNCGLVRQVVATCLDRILIDRWGGRR